MPSQGAALQVGDLENAVSRWAPLFVWGTVGAGSLVIALNVLDVAGAGNWTDLAPFLILAIVAEGLSVETDAVSQESISLSFAVAVAMAAAVALPHGAALVSIPIALTTAVSVAAASNGWRRRSSTLPTTRWQ